MAFQGLREKVTAERGLCESKGVSQAEPGEEHSGEETARAMAPRQERDPQGPEAAESSGLGGGWLKGRVRR